MEVTGTLSGLALNEKGDGRIIEIKLVIPYEPQIFSEFGECFGADVDVAIPSAQLSFELGDDTRQIVEKEPRFIGTAGKP